jgi:hypothetical protein
LPLISHTNSFESYSCNHNKKPKYRIHTLLICL